MGCHASHHRRFLRIRWATARAECQVCVLLTAFVSRNSYYAMRHPSRQRRMSRIPLDGAPPYEIKQSLLASYTTGTKNTRPTMTKSDSKSSITFIGRLFTSPRDM